MNKNRHSDVAKIRPLVFTFSVLLLIAFGCQSIPSVDRVQQAGKPPKVDQFARTETEAKIARQIVRLYSNASVPEKSKHSIEVCIREVMKLYSPDPSIRATEANRLRGTEWAVEFIPELVVLLHDGMPLHYSSPDGRVRKGPTSPGREAMLTLVSIGAVSLEPIMRGWASGGETYRAHAASALAHLLKDEKLLKLWRDDARVIQALFLCLRQNRYPYWQWTPSDSVSAAFILGKLKVAEATGTLIEKLRDKNMLMRASAAEALGMIGAPEAGNALLATLLDPQPSVKAAAAVALGQLREPRFIEPLIEVLLSHGWDAKREAAEALAAIGHRRAIEPLIAIMSTAISRSDSFVSGLCARTLQQLTGERFGEDPAQWSNWLAQHLPKKEHKGVSH